MKKLIFIFAFLSTVNTVNAAFSAPWYATSTTAGFIVPGRINGVEQNLMFSKFVATSTTATSTIAGGFIVGTNNLWVPPSGNIGIGTTSPGNAKLSIISGNPSSSYPRYAGMFMGSGASTQYTSYAIGRSDVDGYFAVSAGNDQYLTGSTAGDLAILSRGNDILFGNIDVGSAGSMIIKNGGNVGIGTTSPSAKLQIESSTSGGDLRILRNNTNPQNGTVGGLLLSGLDSINANTDYVRLLAHVDDQTNGSEDGSFRIDTMRAGSLTEAVRVNNLGYVGVGTTSPSALLNMYTTASPDSMVTLEADSGNRKMIFTPSVSPSFAGRIGMSSAHPMAFITNNLDRITISSDGKVGVATTTPWGEFNVTNSGTVPSFVVEDSASPDTTPFLIDASGNVGIGTSTPAVKLEVSGTGNVAIFGSNAFSNQYLMLRGGGTGSGYFGLDTTLNAGSGGYVLQSGAGKILSFVTNSDTFGGQTASMVISSGGLVGIGTSSPASRLTVESPTTAITSTQMLTVRSNDAMAADTGGGIGFAGVYTTGGASATYSEIRGQKENGTDSNLDGYLQLVTRSNSGGLAERMRITSTGNVGVGTSSPMAKLNVDGNSGPAPGTVPQGVILISSKINTTGVLDMGIDATGLFYSWLQSRNVNVGSYYSLALNPAGGSVGIGTTTPTALLTIAKANAAVNVSDASAALALVSTSNAGIDVGSQLHFSGNTNVGGVSNPFATIAGRKENATNGNYAGYLQFNTSNSSGTIAETMRITSTGNVGIGTTSPAAKLHVLETGAGQFTGMIIQKTGSTIGDEARLDFTLSSVQPSAGAPLGSRIAATRQGAGALSDLYFSTTDGSSVLQERMRISSSGNVGIGTTSPANLLHLYSSNPIVEIDTSSTGALPALKIFELNNLKAFLQWRGTTNSTPNLLQLGTYNTGASIALLTGSNSEAVRIDSNGKVGIGTTTPQYALTSYSATAPQLALAAGTNIPQWTFRNAGGNLYLSTTTPDGTATTTTWGMKIDGETGMMSYYQPHAQLSATYTITASSTGRGWINWDSNDVINRGITHSVTTDNATTTINFAGDYEIVISAIYTSSGPTKDLNLWLNVNNQNIANSNTKVTNASTDNKILSVSLLHAFNAGDQFQIQTFASGTGVTFPFTAASGPAPASPSIIMTIKRVSQLGS